MDAALNLTYTCSYRPVGNTASTAIVTIWPIAGLRSSSGKRQKVCPVLCCPHHQWQSPHSARGRDEGEGAAGDLL